MVSTEKVNLTKGITNAAKDALKGSVDSGAPRNIRSFRALCYRRGAAMTIAAAIKALPTILNPMCTAEANS